jgi:hypothetical protein
MPSRQSETTEPIRGACLCGAVSFEIAAPFHWLALCHCSMCRKHHGTLFGTGLGVERSRFRWLKGQDDIVHYRSTDSFERAFCRRCGSKVPGDSHLPDVVLVPAGTLEADFGIRPRAHIFIGSKSPLYKINDKLTQFEAYPPGVELSVVERAQPTSSRPGTVIGSCLCGDVGFEVSGELGRRSRARSSARPSAFAGLAARTESVGSGFRRRARTRSISVRVAGVRCRPSCPTSASC